MSLLNSINKSDHDEESDDDDTGNYISILHKMSGININVCGEYSKWWFINWLNNWEFNTFHILNYYAPRYGREEYVLADDIEKNIYIDIGSWIGPTVLYAANFYTKVIAIEPDPVALKRLRNNLSVNQYNNIIVVDKALTNVNANIKFGGNGRLGNSESTMLVSNNNYINEGWGGRWTAEERSSNIINVSGITIESLIKMYDINPRRIALIKMDIEGGEFILIPDLIPFLYNYDIPLYISLHYVFLKEDHIRFILKILFDNYKNCYLFDDNGKKIRVTMKKILEEKLTTLVFENISKFNNTPLINNSIIQYPHSIECCKSCNII